MAVLYRHIRLDTNTPFYVGIGQDEKRAYTKKDRNKYWHSIVQKHGYKVHIMLDDLSWEEAQQKEREFIQLYGRKDLGKGGLVNMTDGGEGILGLKHTTKTKVKMRKPKSEEHKAKISAALTGKPKSEEHKLKVGSAFKGKKLSEEHIANREASRKANRLLKAN